MWKNIFRSKSKANKNTESAEAETQLPLCKLCDKCDKCFLDFHLIEKQYICQKCYTKQESAIPPDPISAEFIELHPCPVCSRNFNIKTYAKHVNVCEKIATKKRKAFDSSRQRREGTEYASYMPIKRESLATTSSIQLSHQSLPSVVQQTNKGKFSSPKTTTKLRTPTMDRRDVHEFSRRITKPSFTQQPTEQCPHCGRYFGIKSYDRHVEWCREKALLNRNNNNNTSNVSVAKERLNARIKYKAPNLKSKRALTREKYSGSMSCGASSTSLNEILSCSSSKYKLPDNSSLTKSGYNSMSSSFYSESGVSASDKYDPFMSAKQQLEELFSTATAGENTSTPIKLEKSPSPSPSTISHSTYNEGSISKRRPSTDSIKSNTSNFRRTSSLRAPKPKTKPVALASPIPNIKSNIQCGLSDDNPISMHFVKSSEYDEIPIKAAYNIYNVTTTNNYVKPSMLEMIYSKGKSDILDMKAAAPNNEEYPSTKTESVSLYTKFKNNFINSPVISEKELKDKNNKMINKKIQQTADTNNKFPEINLNNISSNLSNIKLEPINAKSSRKKLSLLTLESILNNNNSSNNNSNSLNNNDNKSNELESSEKIDENFIDPQLINACDNLPVHGKQMPSLDVGVEKKSAKSPVNVEFNQKEKKILPANCLGTSSSSSASSSPLSKSNADSNNNKQNSMPAIRNTLRRRQVKLSKDNILFDTSPDEDADSISNLSDRKTQQVNFNPNNRTSDDVESMFDDFDFDEFISSFEDDEQYPIFKEYKNILLSRAINQTKNSNNYDIKSNTTNNNKTEKLNANYSQTSKNTADKDHEQLFSLGKQKSFTIDKSSRNDEVSAGNNCNNSEVNKSKAVTDEDDNHNLIRDSDEIEKEYMKSVNELEDICYGSKGNKSPPLSNSFPNDSDELSSVDEYSDRRTNKLSADSAYGSLSRNSPAERLTARNHPPRIRQQNTIALECSTPLPNSNAKTRSHKLRENKSVSSSGSESSLPPLTTNLTRSQKIDLTPEKSKGNADKLSKFCHQCGMRFHTQAKFCMECGVKRMSLD